MRRLLILALLLLASRSAESQRTWHPTITGVSPSILQHGASLTLSGSDLSPPGWQRRFNGGRRYGAVSNLVLPYTGNNTQIVLTADKSWGGDSAYVEWVEVDSLARSNPIPPSERKRYLPASFVVQAPPDITFGGTSVTPDLGPSFALMSVANGQGVIKGQWLRRTSYPTVTFAGGSRQVLAHSYEPRGWTTREESCCSGGADRVVFSAPTQNGSGWLVLDNTLGRDSVAVTYALPPAPNQILEQAATGNVTLSPANTLQRGRTYVVRGQNLSIVHAIGGTTSIKRGTVQLGSTAIPPIFASDTNIVFTIPTAFASTSAALSVVTLVGSASLGTFSVISPPAAIDVLDVNPKPAFIIAGKATTFVATLGIPPGTTTLGNLVFNPLGTPTSALVVPATDPVRGTSTNFKVQGGDVLTATPATFRVAHESNGVNGMTTRTQQLSFTVRPPHPIRIEPPAAVIAGTTPTFTVRFDSATGFSSSIFALLTSSNPNVVAVPPSATLSRDEARFTATIPPTTQAGRTSTITATLDGTSVSLPLTVQLPQVQSVVLHRDRFSDVLMSAAPGASVRAAASFNGRLVEPLSIQVTTSDTALREVWHSWNGIDATETGYNRFLVVSPALSQQRTVTVTVTANGSSRSADITLNPVIISKFVATPTGGPAGAKITATALFSIPAAAPMYMAFASADTSLATVSPATSSISGGATSSVVSILLKGPVTTTRSVPITATLRASGSSGPIVSTQTVVVTVSP